MTTSATSSAGVRAAAARVVSAVADQGKSLDPLLARETFTGGARGLHRALCFGTIRWHGRLLPVLAELSDRPPQRLDPHLRALLLVGLYQLLYDAAPEHAAVAETVEAARVLGQPRAAGFVNAVLRRLQRERGDVLERVDRSLAQRTAHPAWLVEQLKRDWPRRYVELLEANNVHPPFWLRVNRRRCDPQRLRERLVAAGHGVETHPIAPDALLVAPAVDVHTLPGFAEGEFSVQDVAAQLASVLLDAQPGEHVLDACAAPGGKTCHLQERADGRLDLVALDISAERLERVQSNLLRLGLSATLCHGDAGQPTDWWDGRAFDRILLDVPCSATGVIRRHPDIKLLRRAADIAPLVQRQAQILAATWPLLRPGGRLVYSTCSLLRIENSEIIQTFMAEHPDARDIGPSLSSTWPASPDPAQPGYALLSGHTGADGFYYACLSKHQA